MRRARAARTAGSEAGTSTAANDTIRAISSSGDSCGGACERGCKYYHIMQMEGKEGSDASRPDPLPRERKGRACYSQDGRHGEEDIPQGNPPAN